MGLPFLFFVAAVALRQEDAATDAVAHAASVRAAAASAARAVLSPPLRVAPGDPSLFFSPYNWLVNGSAASTINAGAYFKCLFQGAWANLSFDVTQMVDPPSQ